MLHEIQKKVEIMLADQDPAHDFCHVMRVYKNAELIGMRESAEMEILLTAVLLHDLVVYPKGSAKSSKSADDSADIAEKLLQHYNYSENKIDRICYCIRTHGYSNKLIPSTIEGKILQDADRLDAIGAIGIARTFSVSGSENRSFYNASDPFCKSKRECDDKQWTLDHFQTKLLNLQNSMHTLTARELAKERTKFMKLFVEQLEREI
jgi:uncharacterized protein